MTKGKYKTNLKFIEFVGGKGNVNFISNEATIQAKYLSGLDMDGILLKLTIHDDGSVDLDEIDTFDTTIGQRERLLTIIEEKTATSYRNRTVIQELEFLSIQKIKDKHIPLYLSVEVIKPIEKLGNLISDTQIEISDDALSNLDSLLDSWLDDDVDTIIDEIDEEIVINETPFISTIEDSFSKMKQQKFEELKKTKEEKLTKLSNLKYQLKSSESQIKEIMSEIELLDSRIDNLGIDTDKNGYYFFVSERMNQEITLDEEVEKSIRKVVSKVKEINVENFMKLFTDGEFQIKFGKKVDDEVVSIDDLSDILDKIPFDNFEIQKDYVVLKTDLIWGKIVNKMIKSGFSQDPKFDEICGSNSYQSKTLNN